MTVAEALSDSIMGVGLAPGSFWLVVSGSGVTITFRDDVSNALRTAANAVIAAFDFSDANVTNLENGRLRTQAANAIAGERTPLARLLVAEALVLKDQLNNLRDWLTDFKAHVATATTLAQLKTLVATLPNLPQFDSSDIITALTNKLNSGDADAS